MVLAMYSILPAVIKWRPANGVVYTFAKMCVKSRKSIDGIETSQKRDSKCLPVNP